MASVSLPLIGWIASIQSDDDDPGRRSRHKYLAPIAPA
jgi:hypothetical protein